MNTTTALELLEHADVLTRRLRGTTTPTTAQQWAAFDDTLYRLLIELIGIDAQHVRTADPSWRALNLGIRGYPTPMRPPLDTLLAPAQVARFEDQTRDAVSFRIRSWQLRAVKAGDVHLVASRDIDTRTDLRPADPLDPHPLAKVSCALGAMADLVHDARTRGPAILTGNGEVAGAVVHVVSLAAVAARHTLAQSDLDHGVRPVQIGRYAERLIDTLRDVALEPVSLDRLASVAFVTRPGTVNDRLEAHLDTWHRLARQEASRAIPSVDVLRQVANQGTHLCDVRARLETDRDSPRIGKLREAAQALAAGHRAWGPLTTLSRPSHEFVTASRDLHESLTQLDLVVTSARASLDRGRATTDIERGLIGVSDLMAMTRSMPERLIDAGILRGPAKVLNGSDDRFHDRAQGRYVQARPADAPLLISAWARASTSLAHAYELDAPASVPAL